ncbi:MAG: hypothetical protein ACOXZ4_06880 [Sphaerochaetaceae bacterium]
MKQAVRKILVYTGILTLILIVALIIANTVGSGSAALFNIVLIVVYIIVVYLLWRTFLTKNTISLCDALKQCGSKKAVASKDEQEATATRTGSVCTQSGTYVCSEHDDKTVDMEEGKRFPPCRGDGKGHSAIWVLQQE